MRLYIYNFTFQDSRLLDAQYVRKLMSMYKLTNPCILFSGVVKINVTSEPKVCTNTAVCGSKAKITERRGSQVNS